MANTVLDYERYTEGIIMKSNEYITSSSAWSAWTVDNCTINPTTTAYSINDTWTTWTSTGNSTDAVWIRWTQMPNGQLIPRRYAIPQPPIVTREQRIITPAQAAELAQQQQLSLQEKLKKSAEAKARSEASLKEFLTPEQQRAWDENRAIFITGQSGKRYKIKEGFSHNFYEVDQDGKEVKSLCAHIDMNLCPVADNVIAQLLALRFNEAMIIKKANIIDLTKPERPLIQRSS